MLMWLFLDPTSTKYSGVCHHNMASTPWLADFLLPDIPLVNPDYGFMNLSRKLMR